MIAIGDIVRPNHKGQDGSRVLDWTRCRGRVLDIWKSPGDMGEIVAEIAWITAAPFFNNPRIKKTTGYPMSMLDKASE